MWRFLAGALASMLMMFGAFLIWSGQAEDSQLPPPPESPPGPTILAEPPGPAPEAPPKTREQKRFDRADKNDDGRITVDELLQPRRKSYAKLDTNGDGRLSFEEWAHTTIKKFRGADSDRSGHLTRAEYATTAPKRRKKKSCSC